MRSLLPPPEMLRTDSAAPETDSAAGSPPSASPSSSHSETLPGGIAPSRILLAKTLSDAGMRVLGYDPLAGPAARTLLQYDAVVVDSLVDCVRDAAAVVVTTPDAMFQNLSAKDLRAVKKRVLVVDFWRILGDRLRGEEGIDYLPAGRCHDDGSAGERLAKLWRESG